MTFGHVVTGPDGSFTLAGLPGSAAEILLMKDGYYPTPWNDRWLHYDSPNEGPPEETTPARLFRMHNLAKRVRVSITRDGGDLRADGSPIRIDTMTGVASPNGDLEVRIQRTAELTDDGNASRVYWTFTLRLIDDAGSIPAGCGFLPEEGKSPAEPSGSCTFTLPDKDAPAGSECSRVLNYYKDQTHGSIGIRFHATTSGLLPPDLHITILGDAPGYRNVDMEMRFPPRSDAKQIAEDERRMAALAAATAKGAIPGMTMADFGKTYAGSESFGTYCGRPDEFFQLAARLNEGFYLWTVETDGKQTITAIHGGLVVPEE